MKTKQTKWLKVQRIPFEQRKTKNITIWCSNKKGEDSQQETLYFFKMSKKI